MPLDAERGALYFDFLMSSLEEAVRRELEAMKRSENWEPQSEWGRRMFGMGREEGREEGRASGRADVLLRIAERRGWALGEALRARIVDCRDVALLDRWVDRALDAATVDEVFSDDAD